jgi:hypothetical protein
MQEPYIFTYHTSRGIYFDENEPPTVLQNSVIEDILANPERILDYLVTEDDREYSEFLKVKYIEHAKLYALGLGEERAGIMILPDSPTYGLKDAIQVSEAIRMHIAEMFIEDPDSDFWD